MAARVRIVWSPLALERVEMIPQLIASERPAATARWLAGILATVQRLRTHPQSGRRVPELEREDLRQIPHPPYRIIYRVESRRVVILTVRHSRREFDDAEVSGQDAEPGV